MIYSLQIPILIDLSSLYRAIIRSFQHLSCSTTGKWYRQIFQFLLNESNGTQQTSEVTAI